MTLNTPKGLNSYFEDDDIPTIEDMSDIISSIAGKDQFRALAAESTRWPHNLTNAEFLDACQDWAEERLPGRRVAQHTAKHHTHLDQQASTL